MTDGNRRRATQAATGRPVLSPTLAARRAPPAAARRSLRQPRDPEHRPPTPMRPGSPPAATGSRSARHEPPRGPRTPSTASSEPPGCVRGPLDPDGESVTAELRKPATVTEVSVLPFADGPRRVEAVDVILHSEDGGETRKRLRFDGAPPERARARIDATGVTEIELRIAEVEGPEPVGLAGVGIAEVGVATPRRAAGPAGVRAHPGRPRDPSRARRPTCVPSSPPGRRGTSCGA